jgi:hypothetical protein
MEAEQEEDSAAHQEFLQQLGENAQSQNLFGIQQPAENPEAPKIPLELGGVIKDPDLLGQAGKIDLPQRTGFPFPNGLGGTEGASNPASPASPQKILILYKVPSPTPFK